MIPPIIHRIWLDDPMPPVFEDWGRRWDELNPAWRRLDWRDRAGLPELTNQAFFDRAKQVAPRDWKRFEADLLRLELLYEHGGIYVDCDVEPLRPLDALPITEQTGCFLTWSPNRGPDGERLLTQAVIGAQVGHPFIKACIKAIPEAIERYRGQSLAKMVGPWLITREAQVLSFDEWQALRMQILDEGWFYPQSNQDRDEGRPLILGGAVAHHRWNTTLRKQGKGLG